jgi:hypothetical protein
MAALVLKSARRVAGSTETYGTGHYCMPGFPTGVFVSNDQMWPLFCCFEIRLCNIPFVCGSNELRLAKYINAKPVNI